MSFRWMRLLAAAVAVALHALSGAAAAQPCHTAQGTERRAVLDATRVPVERAMEHSVELVVKQIRVCGDWAFVIADMQKPGGAEINWSETICSGDVSHLVGALLKNGNDNRWRVKAYELCPTDVPWVDWAAKFNAPAALWQ
jgi:hypothetical protein